MYRGTDQEMAMQQAIFTRRNTDRIMRFAFELARSRPKKHLTSATKSNGIVHTMPFWDERFAAVKTDYPDIRTDQYHRSDEHTSELPSLMRRSDAVFCLQKNKRHN